MNKYYLRSLVGICLVALLVQTADAQRGIDRANYKNHSEIKKIYAELTEPLGDSTIRINADEANIALGTVVDKSGLIVTKASEIADREIVCVIGGDDLKPTVLATDETLDLALLKVDADDLVPVRFAEDEKIDSGQFVVSVDYDAAPESIGVVTVQPREFRMRNRGSQSARQQGYLGVATEANPEGDGVVVMRVESRTPAARAGLRTGDVIIEIAGEKTDSTNQLSRAIKQFKPGEEIAIKFLRGDDEAIQEISAKLGNYASVVNRQYDQWGGGPFSKRRFNFPQVIAHDSVLRPHKMGGPLLNSDGKVIGINVARALRVTTYAIPAAVVKSFVEKNKPVSTGK